MAGRPSANVWHWFFSKHRALSYFWKMRLWRNGYFWQDNLWTPLNRLVGCRILGHRNVVNLGAEEGHHCFNCYRPVWPCPDGTGWIVEKQSV